MPYVPRRRLPRRRQQALHLQSDDQCWSIYLPDPDEPIVLPGFAEAAGMALDAVEMPVRHEIVVLLDEHRQVTAMLLDPPPEVGLLVGMAALPGIEAPFCQTLCIVIEPTVTVRPPTDDERRGYFALRRAHMAQGLLLLDVIVTDGDTIRSLAIACDPDPAWFDEPAA